VAGGSSWRGEVLAGGSGSRSWREQRLVGATPGGRSCLSSPVRSARARLDLGEDLGGGCGLPLRCGISSGSCRDGGERRGLTGELPTEAEEWRTEDGASSFRDFELEDLDLEELHVGDCFCINSLMNCTRRVFRTGGSTSFARSITTNDAYLVRAQLTC
jgi:hypothetical protein